MQQPPDATPLELISISEAARLIGINKSTLSRQVESGAIRSHDGKVVLAEVVALSSGEGPPAVTGGSSPRVPREER